MPLARCGNFAAHFCLAHVWSTKPIGLLVGKLRLCVFGSLHAGRCGCPVDARLPLVLILVTESSCCRLLMLDGSTLVGFG